MSSEFASLERRRERLGWSRAALIRRAGLSYIRYTRGSLDVVERAHLDGVLRQAEQVLVAEIQAESEAVSASTA